jgi:hypothetical protein
MKLVLHVSNVKEFKQLDTKTKEDTIFHQDVNHPDVKVKSSLL